MADPVINHQAARFIPVARPAVGPTEIEFVTRALQDGWISQGPGVARFERAIARMHGCDFGVACNSGTTALHLALKAADVGPQDVVICPTMTMVAVPNMILAAGAIPVFVDSEPDTGNIDLLKLEDVVAFHRPRIKAIIYPHLYGVPIEFRTIPGVVAIEDCAEAHFARFANDNPVGSRGDFACFSFFANKIVACGEGGMVACRDLDATDRMRGLRAHCFSKEEHFNHTEAGFGYRMSDVQAAIGNAQLEHIGHYLDRREALANQYIEELAAVPWLNFQGRTPGSAWWVFAIQVDPAATKFYGVSRDRVRQVLADAGVETRTWFRPMHTQRHLREYGPGAYPVAESLYAHGLYLPLYPTMTTDDVDYISAAIQRI
jgi:perosamine synthetase